MLRRHTIALRLFDHEYSWRWIMGLAFLLRLGLLLILGNDPLEGDSLYYQQVAFKLVEVEGIDTYWPPGLPLYEAAVIWVFGKSTLVLRLAMLPWFFWLCRLFFKLVYRLHSRMAANLGLTMLAIFPALVHQSVEPLSYLPAAALLLAVFGLVQCYLEQRKRDLLWRAAILLGVLILFRPSAALFVVALPILLFVRRRALMPGFVLMVVTGLIVGGWIAIARIHTDRWVPINDANARNLYLGNNPWTPDYKTWYYGSHWTGDPALPVGFRQQLAALDHLPDSVRGKAFVEAAIQHIQASPGKFLQRSFSRVRTLMAFDSFAGTRLLKSESSARKAGYAVLALDGGIYVSILLLSAAFLFSIARREISGRDTALIITFLVIYALPHFLSFSHPTYHLPMVPLMLVLASIWGQVFIKQDFKAPKTNNKWVACVMIALLIAVQVEWIIKMR